MSAHLARAVLSGPAYLALWLLLAGGCGGKPPNDAPTARTNPAKTQAEPAAESSENKTETWDVYYIQGERAGYARTLQQPLEHDGGGWFRMEGEVNLSLKRFGQVSDVRVKLASVESADGLRSFTSETTMGAQPVVAKGRVAANRLVIETATAGRTSIDWPAGAAGFFAIDLDLARRPMQPGERRTLTAMQPMLNVLGTVELTARDYEPTKLLTGTYDLLRIDQVLELQGQKIESSIWADRTGTTLKTRTLAGFEQVAYRATKELALAKFEPFDLGAASTVKLDRPLENAHQTRRATYHVELANADPARTFVTGPTQRVVSTGPHTADVTVIALRPESPADADGAPANDDLPTDDDLEPNDLLQSADRRVVAMAEDAAGDETDPSRLAVALEKYVRAKISDKNYSTALATAAEVARSLEGDCTEHAMLLAAMARARKLPARVAIGLVYVAGQQMFAFHMWTEVYLRGRWVPLDATLGQGGIGAAHLKLGHSNLKGAGALAGLLPVVRVLGQLKIDLIEAE